MICQMHIEMEEIQVVNPFPVEELPRVWMWIQDFPGMVADDLGPKTMEEFVEIEMRRNALTWGVYRGEQLGGYLVFDVDPTNPANGFAHCIFRKGVTPHDSFFGRKITIPALTRAATDLFAIGIERITIGVFEHNAAIQGVIKEMGGRVEAVWFEPVTVRGKPVDVIQYVLTPELLNNGKPGFTYGEWRYRVRNKEDGNASSGVTIRAPGGGQPHRRPRQPQTPHVHVADADVESADHAGAPIGAAAAADAATGGAPERAVGGGAKRAPKRKKPRAGANKPVLRRAQARADEPVDGSRVR